VMSEPFIAASVPDDHTPRHDNPRNQMDSTPRREPAPDQSRTEQRIHVEFEGHEYQLVVSVVPDQAGCMYVRALTGGPRRLAPVPSLKLLGFVGH